MHPSLSQKTVPVNFPAEGTVFGIFFLGDMAYRHLHKQHEFPHGWLLKSFPLSQEIQWLSLTKWHVGDSHFIAVHHGKVRGTYTLILLSCWRVKMPPMFL
jgi:hypothetical protein